MPSDLEVSAIRMKVAFISSMETHMLSNIFPDRSLFNDLKYPTYSYVDFDEGYLSLYLLVIIIFIMCYKKFKMKFKLKYLSNTEDCLYFVKGFLVCSIKDRYREKGHKNEDQWLSTEEVFHQCSLSFQRRKILFVVKKGGSRSFQLHFTYTDGVFVTRSNCQLLFLWHQS